MRGLTELAQAFGLQTSFRDTTGRRVQTSAEALQAVLAVMGVEVGNEPDVRNALRERQLARNKPGLDPVLVCMEGEGGRATIRVQGGCTDAECTLVREDGVCSSWRAELPPSGPGDKAAGCAFAATIELPALPAGYHSLVVEAGRQRYESTVISAPGRAASFERRGWGAFAPVYALRSARNAGAGDVRDLENLCSMVAGLGGNVVGTLPLLATFLDEPFDPSPYAPMSRCAWNEFYAAVDEAMGQKAAKLRRPDLVDYRAVAALKRSAIEKAMELAGSEVWKSVEAFASENPQLEEYARFRGAMAKQGVDWRQWEPRLRDGGLPREACDEDQYRYHLYAQWMIDGQLRDAAGRARERGVALYLDLPVGAHPDGFDAWRYRGIFADGCNVGAPPDGFFAGGQDWGFRPFRPEALREAAYRPLVEALRHHMAVAGVLRIDHVMGFHRLYWVPHGLGARDGVYVRYPADEMYAVICLESARHGVPVVGEDLGTVPREVRRTMSRRGLGRMYVIETELREDDPVLRRPPAGSVASLNTHDMPPFAGFWAGDDIMRRGGTNDELEARRRLCSRLADFLQSEETGERLNGASAVAGSATRWLAKGSAELVLVNLEDTWGERLPQNLPGTGPEEPNWRRKFRYTLDGLAEVPGVKALGELAALRAGEA